MRRKMVDRPDWHLFLPWKPLHPDSHVVVSRQLWTQARGRVGTCTACSRLLRHSAFFIALCALHLHGSCRRHKGRSYNCGLAVRSRILSCPIQVVGCVESSLISRLGPSDRYSTHLVRLAELSHSGPDVSWGGNTFCIHNICPCSRVAPV